MTGTVPLSVAVLAGGLATLNPCGFPLLPAYLSFYLGADEGQLPRAPGRVAQGIVAGLVVAAGFLGVFTVMALPVALGARAVADAVPWAGMAIGVVLATVGLITLLGRQVALRVGSPVRVGRGRGLGTMALFGVGYGIASIGCTLPIFLVLVGASLGTPDGGSVLVFAAYGVGMATVLTAVSVTASLARAGLARFLQRLLPSMNRIGGALLLIAGAYVTYYWQRLELGDGATLADDPIVGFGTRLTAQLEAAARDDGGLLLGAAAAALALAAAVALLRAIGRRNLETARTSGADQSPMSPGEQ